MSDAAIADITLTAFISVCVFCYTWWRVSKLKYLSKGPGEKFSKNVDKVTRI